LPRPAAAAPIEGSLPRGVAAADYGNLPGSAAGGGGIPRRRPDHPGQLRKSWYFFFFDLPGVPESVVHANQWHFFRHFLHDARPAYTPEEMDRYIEAWSQPGAATGMINYYRSSVRTSPKRAEAALRPIKAPTLVIWGQDDGYHLAEPDHDDVPNLDRVERLLGASHWVHHDAAERVTQLLTDFFAPAQPRKD
jgi:pimeloyl-ACP methyl ester carboxylesterase